MTQTNEEAIPKPLVKKMRWPYPVIWIVPVLAAVALLYFFRGQIHDNGVEIAIQFHDASGLKPGETPVLFHGVTVGIIKGIDIDPDQQHVLVHAQFSKSHEAFANNGASFWVVRPEFMGGSISGLDTLMSGPYIEALPGGGDRQLSFVGLEGAPKATGPGLTITLHAPRLERVQPDSPVSFRGIQVGVIRGIQLSHNATGVDIELFIPLRYSPLVRSNSQFWAVNPVDIKGGIFTGMQLKLDSLKSLISGGVAFATPELETGQPARQGDHFPLYDEPKKEWMNWAPQIAIDPDAGKEMNTPDLPRPADAVRSAVQ